MAQKKATAASKGGRTYVFSTLTNDQHYVNWEKGPHDVPVETVGVHIKGGTGIANDRLITPLGVCTEVSDAEHEMLKRNPIFQQHVENGHIIVRTSKADPEKVAADMLPDASAPKTPSDYEGAGENDVQEPTAQVS